MDAFELSAKLSLDSSGFERDLNRAESQLRQLSNSLTSGHGFNGGLGNVADSVASRAESAAARVSDAVSETGETTRQEFTQTEQHGKKSVDSLSSWAIAKAQLITQTITKIATTVGRTVKDVVQGSLEEYANFQQLEGGVKTLFGTDGRDLEQYLADTKDASDKNIAEYTRLQHAQELVFSNADQAYKTAGMSANEYMETATSFAATLIKSLKGDTYSAAVYANMAIQDMSDNANKFGTDMEMIQNAYMGFSRQNYMMLDNLKLGYAGSKQGMEQLLKDAEKLTKKKYDINNLADIFDAIHAIQTELGITGTTAEEAEGTISGSIGMVKASWKNLLAAFGDPNADINAKIGQFTESLKTAAENVIPAVGRILKNMWDYFLPALKSTWDALKGQIGNIWDNVFGDGSWEATVEWVQKGWETVKEALELIQGFVKDWKVTVSFVRLFWNLMSSAFSLIGEWTDKTWKATVEWHNKLWNTITDAFKEAGKWVDKTWKTTVEWHNNLWDSVNNAFKEAGKWADKTFQATIEWVNSAWDAVGNAFTEVGKWVGDTAHTIKVAWESTVDNWITTIKGWLGITAGSTKVNFSATVEGWFNTIKDWLGGVKGVHINFTATVAEWIQKIANWIHDGISIGINFLNGGENANQPKGGRGAYSGEYGYYSGSGANPRTGTTALMNAKGNWDVPYDDFPALLHRNEMVLTASQARQYREGANAGFDMETLVSSIVSAIQSGMQGVTIDSYISGRRVTDDVNRQTVRQLKARRFAT